MNVYLVPTILYVVAIVFGVVWIWLCGGFEKYEVRWRKYLIVYKQRSLGWTELMINSGYTEIGGNLYEGHQSRPKIERKLNETKSR